METEVQSFIARALAHRFIPRTDSLAQRALTDEAFRQELDMRLAACGMALLDNPYAAHLTVALKPGMEEPVFGQGDNWLASNIGLPRDALALLVVLWALIVLPKRERQVQRQSLRDEAQNELFATAKPIRHGEEVSAGVAESTLLADFGEKLGGKTRLKFNLGTLSRFGFIERRNNVIHEGPMLDLLLDYGVLAPRIMEGALADLLARRKAADGEQKDD